MYGSRDAKSYAKYKVVDSGINQQVCQDVIVVILPLLKAREYHFRILPLNNKRGWKADEVFLYFLIFFFVGLVYLVIITL
jgi:hypothetical protein